MDSGQLTKFGDWSTIKRFEVEEERDEAEGRFHDEMALPGEMWCDELYHDVYITKPAYEFTQSDFFFFPVEFSPI